MIAHLNSGPRDDHRCELPDERDHVFVAQVPSLPLRANSLTQLEANSVTPAIRQGLYQARLDEFGQFVPHDLESVEFDWRGWQ